MPITGFTRDELAEFFDYLDDLRSSGVTNMFGAGSYLADEFEMETDEARSVLSAWMKSFERDKLPSERAREVLEAENSKALGGSQK